MKTFTLPGTDIVAPNVVLGLMRIADASDDEIRELVRTARDAGIDFVDHADVYGRDLHDCERRFAEAMQLSPSERDAVTIQTIGNAGKIADFLRVLEPFGIRELVQSGAIAIGRGPRSISERGKPVAVPVPPAASM